MLHNHLYLSCFTAFQDYMGISHLKQALPFNCQALYVTSLISKDFSIGYWKNILWQYEIQDNTNMLYDQMTLIRFFRDCQGHVAMNELFLIWGLPVSSFDLRYHYVLEQDIICQISVKCIPPSGAKFHFVPNIRLIYTTVRLVCFGIRYVWINIFLHEDIIVYRNFFCINVNVSLTILQIYVQETLMYLNNSLPRDKSQRIFQYVYIQKHIYDVFILFKIVFGVNRNCKPQYFTDCCRRNVHISQYPINRRISQSC